MNYEQETKVLGVNVLKLVQVMRTLKAKKISETRLIVDWFRPLGTKEGEDPWFLRIRTNSRGISEITWKGKSKQLRVSRKHKEININTKEPATMSVLFECIGLEKYAHQEKDRTTWTHKNWKFELDSYPEMPPYLEIEGKNDKHIQKAIRILGLDGCETSSEGERILIQEKYGLDWYNMRF